MRIGIITDVHLAPAGHPPAAFHNSYALNQAAERFQRAIKRCQLAGADVIAMLGDLAHCGDEASLRRGVALAATCGHPVWMVAGNHDLLDCNGALPRAVAGAGAPHLRMAPAAGEEVAGFRVAAAALASGTETGEGAAREINVAPWGYETVVLLSHFPLISLRAEAAAAGLKYAGDLDRVEQLAVPLLERPAPTIFVHGHLHLGHTVSRGPVLQVSCPALIEPPFAVTLLQVDRIDGHLAVRRYESLIAPVSDVALPRLSASDQTWLYEDGAWRQSVDGLAIERETASETALIAG